MLHWPNAIEISDIDIPPRHKVPGQAQLLWQQNNSLAGYTIPTMVHELYYHTDISFYTYSGTSDKGPSEIGTTSKQRT